MYENRRMPGRMGPFVEGYRSRLLCMGYTPGTVEGQLKALGQIGRWMQAKADPNSVTAWASAAATATANASAAMPVIALG